MTLKTQPSKRAALMGVKTFHTVAFFSIGGCLLYLFYSGVARRSAPDRPGKEYVVLASRL